ncbi:unnamed protein product [Echinostoma caproni]|uniref:Lipopolysaccharide choline phosphotransferase protein n=1 Tax=Echinostoma caproni TaxID=27848 RepID=A0A183ATU1_9TREM|nr:unnamed protein product [Echinostoma caproni]
MKFQAVWHALAATKITLTVSLAFLLGIAIEQVGRLELDAEIRYIGTFDHPNTFRCARQLPDGFEQPFQLDPFLVKPHKTVEQQTLPNLSELVWPEEVVAPRPADRINLTEGLQPEMREPFKPVMSKGQMAVSRRLLQVFSDLMFEHGYGDRFWLQGGTLVGSYHFHDFIPWDDDVDVLADAELRPEIQRLLKTLEPDYQWYEMVERDKLFTKPINSSQSHLDLEYSRYTADKPWAWPFMDIGYYQVGPTHTCESTWRLSRGVCIPNSVIFPLIYRPFGKQWYPTPSNVPVYLRSLYREHSSCVTFGYSHILEGGSQVARVPCHTLADQYAFMRHVPVPNAMMVSINNSLSTMFMVDLEQLVKKSENGWDVIHELRLPIQLVKVNDLDGYGIPEQR